MKGNHDEEKKDYVESCRFGQDFFAAEENMKSVVESGGKWGVRGKGGEQPCSSGSSVIPWTTKVGSPCPPNFGKASVRVLF
ncbi:protein of unknown function [Kyrpidia spormannii]|uniref:Uncharacterized protein n=2 Tax=Kyrpidia spormannii TaxID=2055160 RepID=A0ACA8Z7X2_9BACL|nr:protein of unknown function [Kyrpidia spormannii]CAB3392689.1 protein of unknown function [Kyrpidia spormannii]